MQKPILVQYLIELHQHIIFIIFLNEGVTNIFGKANQGEFIGGGRSIACSLSDNIMAQS